MEVKCSGYRNKKCIHGFPIWNERSCFYEEGKLPYLESVCMKEEYCGVLFEHNGGKPEKIEKILKGGMRK